MEEMLFILLVGVFFGLAMTLLWDFLERRFLFKKIKLEAGHILEDTQERRDESFELNKKECEKKHEKKRLVFEKEKELLNSKLQSMEDKMNKKRNEFKAKKQAATRQISEDQSRLSSLRIEKKRIWSEKQQNQSFLREYQNKRKGLMGQKASLEIESLKKEVGKELKEDWKDYVKNNLEAELASLEDRQGLKKTAGFYLYLALNRFHRSSCSERGVPAVKFKNKRHLESAIGEDKKYLDLLEKECGVDFVVNEENLSLSVFGIDPVRREWGRLSLEKLSLRSKVNPSSVKKIIRLSKEKLFSKIKDDGLKICKRLKLKNVAPEVQNMMGALRYRYSFAQNQHFHCEEVGWLCGLLSLEMDLPLKTGQRAGMFHDIGKAMDHSMEGGHAVIGAEFLSIYKEDPAVIHAVKAHHHDEPPSSPLAYLVIVADSISGSRPGARRFTEDSFNQKIASLEKILQSFDHIEDFYIMNAGREIRVIVNPHKISDEGVIGLSQKIAKEVEKECSYPGMIKVTVVRRSEASATA